MLINLAEREFSVNSVSLSVSFNEITKLIQLNIKIITQRVSAERILSSSLRNNTFNETKRRRNTSSA